MNYYVMDRNSQLLYRNTLEGCRTWAREQNRQWKNMGLPARKYRIFYDSASSPCEIIETP